MPPKTAKMVRLSEAGRAGRAMKKYVELPPATIKAPAALRKWFEQSPDYAATLPAKKKPAKKGR